MPRPCRPRRKRRPMPTLKATPRLVEPKFTDQDGTEDAEMMLGSFVETLDGPNIERKVHYFEGSTLKIRISSEVRPKMSAYFRPEESSDPRFLQNHEEKENDVTDCADRLRVPVFEDDQRYHPHRIHSPAQSRSNDSDAESSSSADVDNESSSSTSEPSGVSQTARRSRKQTSVTDFFAPVRRSSRRTTGAIAKEKECRIVQAVRSDCEEGLAVHVFPGKGRGVVAARNFAKGDFVVEYSGDLVDMKEAEQRELTYACDKTAGCYMYYFEYQNRQLCVDATRETGRLGRLINHSRSRANLTTKTLVIDGQPRLVLFATRDIQKDEELLYDYGDRRKQSLAYHPWLAL